MNPEGLAHRYDTLHRGTGFGDTPRFYDWIVRRADLPRDSVALDIGCGSGGALRALAERGVRAIGLDFSGVALERARTVSPTATLIRGNGARLPFADGSIPALLNLGNLEHFADLAGGIREMRRVLATDGRAWVLLPNLFYSGVLWRVLRGREGPNHHQPIDRFATREEWLAWLEWGGLRVVRTIPYHKGKRLRRLLPSAFAWHFLYECVRGEPSSEAPPPAPLGRAAPGIVLGPS